MGAMFGKKYIIYGICMVYMVSAKNCNCCYVRAAVGYWECWIKNNEKDQRG